MAGRWTTLAHDLIDTVERWRALPRGLRPAEPVKPNASGWMWWSNGWGDTALPGVTDPILMGLPAAWRCTRMIANAVASMAPPRAVAPDLVTQLEVPNVVARPNASYGITEWWYMAVAHAITTGNFVGLQADFDPTTGWPRQIVPVRTEMVNGYYDDDGFVRYDIGDMEGLTPTDVVHVRGHVIPGSVMGIGVVDAFRRTIGEKLDQQNFAANSYLNGAIPSGILKPGITDTSQAQVEAVQDRWVERFGSGQRKPAVVPDDWEFQPLSWSPEDMEFLESRRFSVAEIALMFDMDPSDVGASLGGSPMTYVNLQARQSARVVDTYAQWIARFEDAWSDLTPGGGLVRFKRENYLHASRRDLFEEQEIGIRIGVLTEDEAREELNKPPLPKPDPPPTPLLIPSTTGTPEALPPGEAAA